MHAITIIRSRCRSLDGIDLDESLSLLNCGADFYGQNTSAEYPADSSEDDLDELWTADSPSTEQVYYDSSEGKRSRKENNYDEVCEVEES